MLKIYKLGVKDKIVALTRETIAEGKVNSELYEVKKTPDGIAFVFQGDHDAYAIQVKELAEIVYKIKSQED